MGYKTELIRLLDAFPYKKWDWEYINENPNINIEFVKKKYDKAEIYWFWQYISKNKSISFIDIKNNLNLPWNWKYVSLNPNITNDIILNNPSLPWNLKYIKYNVNNYITDANESFSPLLENEIYPRLVSKDLNNYNLLKNKNSDIISLIDKNNLNGLNWYYISKRNEITWDIIKNNNFPWNWSGISINPNINWDIIISNTDKRWDWSSISENPNITWDIIINNPDKPWDWRYISKNPNITFNIIRDNPDKPWDWYFLSMNLFNYHPYFQSEIYIKKMTKIFHDYIHEELIAKSCTPNRIYNWNEDFCEQYPEEYELECNKIRFL